MLLSAGWEIGPTQSSAGGPNSARIGANTSSGVSPVYAQTTPHIFWFHSSSGKGATAGTDRKAKKPLSSSGALVMKSRYQRSTSAERSSGQSIGPAVRWGIGWSRKTNEVTTPKLPPPPRSAQKRSEF